MAEIVSFCREGLTVAERHANADARTARFCSRLVHPHNSTETAAVAGLLLAKDQPVLAAAIRLRCDALVTGDRAHFAALYGRAVYGVAVHSPRSLADAQDLLRSGWCRGGNYFVV